MTRKKRNKKEKQNQKPRVNKELEGFDIEIDAFGEIKTNYDINKINEFLNREVDDKKLRHLQSESEEGTKSENTSDDTAENDEQE